MADQSRKIALITAHGWVGISTPVIMTARYLAQLGYLVDLFIDEDEHCRELGIDLPVFRESGIRIITFRRPVTAPNTTEAFPGVNPTDLSFVQHTCMSSDDYKWLVGFDPHGLVRAALLAEKWHVPFIYHSLEIYDVEDSLKQLERLFSQQALLTVTQDNARADTLARINGVVRDRVVVVYNSSLGNVTPEKKNYFRDKFALSPETVIVLATGTLLPITCVDRLIHYAPYWPSKFVLVLHGWIPDSAFKEYVQRECVAHPTRILFSNDIIPADQKSVLFQSADIGLVFYSADDTNLAYAAGSSGKIYDCMQAGVPVIANDIVGMRELVEVNGFGAVVADAAEIANILPLVVQNYQQMKERGLASFGRYSFSGSYNSLIAKIEQMLIAPPVCSAAPDEEDQMTPEEIDTMPLTSQLHYLTKQALLALKANHFQTALDCVIRAKALRKPEQGLDYIRAICFNCLGRPHEAYESLKEELRSFPDNQDAALLLERMHPDFKRTLSGTDEFSSIINIISPYTMIGEHRLYSLYTLARTVCEQDIPGNFVECGVAAGGSSALLAFVIKRHSKSPRKLYSCDTFSGMPVPGIHDIHAGIPADATGWGTGTCAAPVGSLLEVCNKLGVADLVVPVKGFFEETLPIVRDQLGMVALLHLDGDWYESTKCILENLFDYLTDDSSLQFDDYGYWEGCRKAVHEFEHKRNIHFDLHKIDSSGVYCRKPEQFRENPELPLSLIEDFKRDDPVRHHIASQMSNNERFQLYYTIRTQLPRSSRLFRFIEISSFTGGPFHVIGMALQSMGIPSQGIVVDSSTKQVPIDIIKKFGCNALDMSQFSPVAAERLLQMLEPDNLPGFILIDGNFDYQSVCRYIKEYYPLLAPRGIMMFHYFLPAQEGGTNQDTSHANNDISTPEILQACRDFLEKSYGLEPLKLPLLCPNEPPQARLPINTDVFSTIKAYRKP